MMNLALFVAGISFFTLSCRLMIVFLRRPLMISAILPQSERRYSRTALRFARTYKVMAATLVSIALFYALVLQVIELLSQPPF